MGRRDVKIGKGKDEVEYKILYIGKDEDKKRVFVAIIE